MNTANMLKLLQLPLGVNGSEIIDDNDAHDGDWYAFQVIGGTAILDTLEQHPQLPQVVNMAGLVGPTFVEGTVIRCFFKKIELNAASTGILQCFNTAKKTTNP
jgi:hypothetical protein